MAVTGKLAADFESFYSAVQKSEVYLKSFETSAGKVETQLNKTVNAFSGQKIISEATIVTEAIGRIGDASNLTENEARQVNATLTEAIEKARAFGGEAPEAWRKLQAEIVKVHPELQKTPQGIQGIIASLGPLAGAVGIGFGIAEVVSFGKEILNDADAMVRLSDKTGIAIEPLQRLKYTAEQSGNTIEQVTGAVTQMQNRLAEGDESAVNALTQLGLSFDQIKRLNPDQQFKTIAAEIATIPDPMERTRVAMDLFGRAGAEVLPTMLADFEALGNQAPVMSEKATRAFDDIGDATNRVYTGFKNLVGESIGTAIDGFSRLGQTATAFVRGEFGRIPAIMLDIEGAAVKVPPALKLIEDAMKGPTLSVKEFNEIEKELTSKTLKDIERATVDFKRAQDALFGRDLIQRALDYKEQLGGVENVTKLTKDKKQELKQAIERALEAYKALGEVAPPELQKILEASTKVVYSMEDMDKWAREIAEKSLPPLTGLLGEFTTKVAPLPKILDDAADSGARFHAEVIEPLVEDVPEAVEALNKLGQASRPFGDFTTQGVATPNAFDFTNTQGTDPRVLGYLREGYTLGEALSLASGVPTNIGLPRRAAGGPIDGPAIVGEHGPEIFVPGTAGTILPNGAGLGGLVFNINVNAGLGDKHTIARAVSDAIRTLFQGMGQRFPSLA